MKPLPPTVAFHRRTPEFTERSIPDALRRSHRTKAEVWGRIVVLEGRLRYRILASPAKETILDAGNPGIVEPQVEHEVEPLGHVRFFVEFYRQSTVADDARKAIGNVGEVVCGGTYAENREPDARGTNE